MVVSQQKYIYQKIEITKFYLKFNALATAVQQKKYEIEDITKINIALYKTTKNSE